VSTWKFSPSLNPPLIHPNAKQAKIHGDYNALLCPVMKFGGHLFWTCPRLWIGSKKGKGKSVLKMAKWAHFEIYGLIFAQIESDHYSGFSRFGRIGKQGIIRGFLSLPFLPCNESIGMTIWVNFDE
jgi:hypothetical protein